MGRTIAKTVGRIYHQNDAKQHPGQSVAYRAQTFSNGKVPMQDENNKRAPGGGRMTVYRDAKHCIARVMSIETNDGTTKSGWQAKYQAPGWPETRQAGSGLTDEERLTQDSMTRALLHRELSAAQWHSLVARRSINDTEVAQSIHWLATNARTPASNTFRMKAVTAWVLPKRSQSQKSTRSLPDEFYLISSWDEEGRPEGTLRRWKSITDKWLNMQINDAHNEVERLLQENRLKIDEAA